MKWWKLIDRTGRGFFLLNIARLIFFDSSKRFPYGFPLYILYEPVMKTGILSLQIHQVFIFNVIVDLTCSYIIGFLVFKPIFEKNKTSDKPDEKYN